MKENTNMPFCKVYINKVGEDFVSFEGYFKSGGDTIYSAVKTTDPEFEDCRSSFEAVDVPWIPSLTHNEDGGSMPSAT